MPPVLGGAFYMQSIGGIVAAIHVDS
jgi:hypothetical protein